MNRRSMLKLTAAGVVLSSVLFLQGCGFNAATELRAVLAASGPLVSSLPLGDKKAAVVADFSELAGDASAMAESFNTCASSKPCKLTAVEKFEGQFEVVDARGNFGVHQKLQTVEGILRGLIASARIYYGGSGPASKTQPRARGTAPQVVTEADLKAQIDALKVAMKP